MDIRWPAQSVKNKSTSSHSYGLACASFWFASNNESPGTVKITTSVLQQEQTDNADKIQCMAPDDAQHTLGIHPAPTATGKTQLNIICNKVKKWCKSLQKQGVYAPKTDGYHILP